MQHTCIECGKTVSSWRHTAKDDEGHGINPLCDGCFTIETNLDKQDRTLASLPTGTRIDGVIRTVDIEPGVYVAPTLGINYVEGWSMLDAEGEQ